MRRLFGEGAFATAFIPVLTEFKADKDSEKLRKFIDSVAGTLGFILLFVSFIGMFIAPIIISLFAFGWVIGEEHEKLELASDMLVITFPYLFFISLTAFAGGIMNAFGRFAVPAFTPIILNLSLIACAIWLSEQLDEPIFALAWGVLIAGAAQFFFQLPFLGKLKIFPKPKINFKNEGVRKIFKLMIPALFAVSITQINLLIDLVLASFLVTGSISWLYYSDRLMEFPLGVLGVALATVLLPSLSKENVESDPSNFNKTLNWGFSMALIFGLPSAIGLAILAGPMISTLFLSDVFTSNDVKMSQLSLIAYSSGLLGFILVKVFSPAYYAQQDTKTPVKIAIIAMCANIILNLILIVPLQHSGLALATSLAAYLNAFLLWKGLQKHNLCRIDTKIIKLIIHTVVAAFAMGALLFLLSPDLIIWMEKDLGEKILYLISLIFIGIICYFFILVILGWRPKSLKIYREEK